MRYLLVPLVAAFVVAPPLAAQSSTATLPPIPEVRTYLHSGAIEKMYDDDENSTSVALDLRFDEKGAKQFVRRGRVKQVSLGAGFVYAGKVMTRYPDVVTVVLKLTRAPSEALKADKLPTDLALTLDGVAVRIGATLVARNAISGGGGAMREIEDTYVAVLTLPQFLRIVNASSVSATLQGQSFEFTGSPLEGMRDLASRIVVSP